MGRKKSQTAIPPLLLLAVLLLGGCTGFGQWNWKHVEGLGERARLEAIQECEAIAKEELRHFNSFYLSPYYFDQIFDRDPHYPFYSSYYWNNSQMQFQARRQFFRICMKAKGWRLVKTPPVATDKP